MSESVRISATTAKYTSTKWAKSRNSKNLRSSSGSTGTTPGWRMASSETIAGDAEPTWCTCSSALGSPAMNDDRSARWSTGWSLSAGEPVVRTDHRRGQQAEQQPRREHRPDVDHADARHRHQPDHA